MKPWEAAAVEDEEEVPLKPWEMAAVEDAPVEEEAVVEDGPSGLTLATAAVEEALPFGEEGFLGRTLDTARGGLSDAMSTYAGDTYGLSGDPTERDMLGPNERDTKILGRDLIPAGADIIGDAITTLTPDFVKEGLTEAVAWADQKYGPDDPLRRGAEYALDKSVDAYQRGKEALDLNPRQAATAEELFNIGTAGIAPRVRGVGGFMDEALVQSRAAERLKDTKLRMEPDNRKGEGTLEPGGGIMDITQYIPDPGNETRRINLVNDIEGYDPKQSYTRNHIKVEEEVGRRRAKLDAELVGQEPIPVVKVRERVKESMVEAREVPHLVGDAEKSAEKIYAKFDSLLHDAISKPGVIDPQDLLNVRRQLDNWLRENSATVFNPETMSATKTATQHIRRSLNDLVEEGTTNVAVKKQLQDMSDLLIAKEQFYTRSLPNYERPSRPGRAVQRIEHATGFSAPTTPIAAGSSLAITAPLAAGVLGYNATKRGIQSNVNAAVNMGETAGIRSALINSRAAAEEEENR